MHSGNSMTSKGAREKKTTHFEYVNFVSSAFIQVQFLVDRQVCHYAYIQSIIE